MIAGCVGGFAWGGFREFVLLWLIIIHPCPGFYRPFGGLANLNPGGIRWWLLLMNRSLFFAVAILLGLTLYMLTGLLRREPPSDTPSAEAGASARPLLSVRVRTSEAETIAREVVMTGQTAPNRQVHLRAEIEGTVEEIFVERGKPVKAGDRLLRLSANDRPQRVAEAETRVRQREQEYAAANRLRERDLQSEVFVATARAELRAAERQLRQAQLDLERTVIRAPFDALLNERAVEVGDRVGVGDALVHLLDLDPLIVVGHVLEVEAPLLAVGERGRARLPGGRTVEGRIRFVSAEAHPSTRTFRVELLLDNPGYSIPAGLSADIVVETEQVKAHAVSPAIIAIADDGRFGVKYVDETDTVRFVAADVVRDTPEALFLSGLPDSIRLITVGQGFASEGQPVDAVPEQARW